MLQARKTMLETPPNQPFQLTNRLLLTASDAKKSNKNEDQLNFILSAFRVFSLSCDIFGIQSLLYSTFFASNIKYNLVSV